MAIFVLYFLIWFLSSVQVIDIVDRLFVAMFDSLKENCKKELEAIDRQYSFEPLKVTFFIYYLLPRNVNSVEVLDILVVMNLCQ